MERRLEMGMKFVGNLHADEKLIEIAEEEEWNQVDKALEEPKLGCVYMSYYLD